MQEGFQEVRISQNGQSPERAVLSNRRHSDLVAGGKLEKDQAKKGTDMEEDGAETEKKAEKEVEAGTEMLLKGEMEAEAEEVRAESQAEAVRRAERGQEGAPVAERALGVAGAALRGRGGARLRTMPGNFAITWRVLWLRCQQEE